MKKWAKKHLQRRVLRWCAGFLLVALGLSVVGWVVTACGIEIGVTQELVIDEPLGGAAVTEVEIQMGAGDLQLTPGSPGLASGTIRYNVPAWEPKVTRTDTRLSIKQSKSKSVSSFDAGIVNNWDLKLGKAPMRLRVSAGAYQGTYDLSGLTLLDLTIEDGAARTKVMFNSVNPAQMEKLSYKTGASSVTLIGLANANFKSMKFEGGAGSYSLDFSGQLRTDAKVEVEAGAGSLRLTAPASTAARVTLSGSLNDVDTEGDWTVSGDTYSTPAAITQGQGRLLTIAVKMSLGSVTLVAE